MASDLYTSYIKVLQELDLVAFLFRKYDRVFFHITRDHYGEICFKLCKALYT